MRDLLMEAMESIERLYERRGAISGLPTGLTGLDRLTDGLHVGELIVIASRSGGGKTALATAIAEHVALVAKVPTAFFSLEMDRRRLVRQRLLCSRARVDLQAIRDGRLRERDFTDLVTAFEALAAIPLFVDDTPALSIGELRARARSLNEVCRLGLIVVDCLQLVRLANPRSRGDRQTEVIEAAAGLKRLAKKLGVPVVVTSQLTQPSETYSGGRAQLDDLRVNELVSETADLVLVLDRPELERVDGESRRALAGEASLTITKHRNGALGEISLCFSEKFTRFEEPSQ